MLKWSGNFCGLQTYIELKAEGEMEELLSRLAEGDRAAWGEIYELYKREVLGVCMGILREMNEAMDATEETFLKVFSNATAVNPNGNFRVWLLKIATNICKDKLRKEKHQQSWLRAQILRVKPDWQKNRVEEQVQSDLAGQAIREALESLEERYRIPLVLRFYADMSYEEIAVIVSELEGEKLSKFTIGSRISRGKELLKQTLIAKGVHHAGDFFSN